MQQPDLKRSWCALPEEAGETDVCDEGEPSDESDGPPLADPVEEIE
jgi:hypothetical protein